MKKSWSKLWKSSSQKRKQRKYSFKAPLHIKHRMLGANLSNELKKEYNTRSVRIRKGDTVKVLTGQFKNQSAKVTKVSLSRTKIYLENIGTKRADGSLKIYPIHPSNLQIIKLDLSDKRREEKLMELKKENGKQ
jgi:large subunit ribosomal protein L24